MMTPATALRRLFALCGVSVLGWLLAVPVSAQTLFTDVTEEIGVGLFPSRSIAFGDYDNDGRPDLFCAENGRRERFILLHNEGGGRFADRTDAIQMDIPTERKGGGAVFGDYDNDGDLDLFVPIGRYAAEDRTLNLLLRNDRGLFHDVAREAGLTDDLPTDNAIWLDYDRDGHIDLYMGKQVVESYAESFLDWKGDPTVRNMLYRNNGDGTFTDATEQAGLDVVLQPEFGGFSTGLVAGDFNDDGWPDLYVSVPWAPNRLFVNDGHGRFEDATTSEIGDPGDAWGAAVGDVNHDGNLDIYQAAGGASSISGQRSLMLMNLGEGNFLDVTEGVGLSQMVTNSGSPVLADIDNDGDLDLVIASAVDIESSNRVRALFVNDGHGTFLAEPSRYGLSPYLGGGGYLSVGDYTGNGFLDIWFEQMVSRNSGNANHWLRVELVGVESNRSGIGTRLVAASGELRQIREIFGGTGYTQDELVAHFGLGDRTQVDRLEIRWPSGQMDVLTDIAADQKIRVFEGREGFHRVDPTMWITSLPDSLVAGGVFNGTLRVRPALFEPEAEITGVVADLREMGGGEAVPLQASGDGTWQLATTLNVPEAYGYKKISVMVDQSTSVGDYWTQLSHTLLVLPAENQEVFVDGVGRGWQLGPAEAGAERKLGFVSDWDGMLEIYLIDENGKNQVRLTQSEGHIVTWMFSGVFWPQWDWSPDGEQIVVASHMDGLPAIYVMNSDGTDLRQLTYPEEEGYDLMPSWSPDGTKIAFTSNRTGDEEIWVMDADGINPVQLTDHPEVDRASCWSPDGAKIAFSTRRHASGGNSNREIYVMDADGSNLVRLTDSSASDHSPSWSPDGTKIAFRTGGQGIFVMDADGSNPTSLPRGQSGWAPSWSPDGTKIAFWDADRGIALTIGLDGTGLTRVVQPPEGVGVFLPIWLPGGASSPVQVLNAEATAVTYRGRRARELQAERRWLATYQSVDPVMPTGYSLNFAFHPGDAAMLEGGWLEVRVNDRPLDLLEERVDVTRREWQEVEIPLEAFGLEDPVEQIEFSGLLTGTFYLADLRLVTAGEGLPLTAVTEEQVGLPGRFALEQNYPNPFNSGTVIRYALPIGGDVELTIFNLTGQRVAKLVEGVREAGTYTLHWDGRDDDGRQLASGVYLYRLRAGKQRVETRKLLLLR